MVKNTEWNNKNLAKNYELGRPLNSKIISNLFHEIKRIIKSPYNNKILLDAGCGTGRVTFPLAQKYKQLKIIGIDKSKEMLSVLKNKVINSKIKNYEIVNGNLTKIDYKEDYFDFSLISSVLHSIKNWESILREIIRVTKKEGFLFLLSEEGEIYNIALGRSKSKNRNITEKFWGTYTDLRHKNRLRDPEESQIGIKWQLGHPELIAYLNQKGYLDSIKKVKIKWKKDFTVKDFMNIVECRCWSSMFTADDGKYRNLVKDMKQWLKDENISLKNKCPSNFIIKCDIVKLKNHTF